MERLQSLARRAGVPRWAASAARRRPLVPDRVSAGRRNARQYWEKAGPDAPCGRRAKTGNWALRTLQQTGTPINVGATFRSVAGIGFDAVLLSPRCADPLYRRAIKVAMGSVFRLPYARIGDWYDAPDLLERHGFQRVAMALGDDAIDLAELRVGEKVALLVGSEGHGLSHRWRSTADDVVTIPMAADIDSLNVAASVAVACWAIREY